MLHREDGVARRHAAPAVHGDRLRRSIADDGPHLRRDLLGRPETTIRPEVIHVEEVPRPRDVTGDRIDGLDLAPVAAGRAHVDEHPVGIPRPCVDRLDREDGELPRGGLERRDGMGCRELVRRRHASGHRGGETAVEDAHATMAERPEHPPGPGRGVRPALRVVDDDVALGADPHPGEPPGEGRRFRKGMPTALGRIGMGTGELGLEVEEAGAREVRRFVGSPRIGTGPRVEEDEDSEPFAELGRAAEGAVGHARTLPRAPRSRAPHSVECHLTLNKYLPYRDVMVSTDPTPKTPLASLLAFAERRAPRGKARAFLEQARRDVAVLESALLLGERPSPLIPRRAKPAASAPPVAVAKVAEPAIAEREAPKAETTFAIRFEDRGVTTPVVVAEGQTMLEAVLNAGVDLPFSCTLGGCGTCKVRLLEGEIELDEPNCLMPEELEAGWRLSCVGRPKSDCHVRIEREPA